MMQIVVGLNLACVTRLERTWEGVGNKYSDMFKALMVATSASRNYLMYREALRTTVPPAIPYVGVYLRDLTFIEDGNPSYMAKDLGLVNFDKVRMLARVLGEIRTFQQIEPVVEPHTAILSYLTTDRPLCMVDSQLRTESMQCEAAPRHSTTVSPAAAAAAATAAAAAAAASASLPSVASAAPELSSPRWAGTDSEPHLRPRRQ